MRYPFGSSVHTNDSSGSVNHFFASFSRSDTRDNHFISPASLTHRSYMALSPTYKNDGLSCSSLQNAFILAAAVCNTVLSDAFPSQDSIQMGKLATPVVARFNTTCFKSGRFAFE